MINGGYPEGAEFDERAPYNQFEQPEVPVEVTASYSLSKSQTIYTNDYNHIVDYDVETDEDGRAVTYGGEYNDFSESNLKAAYEHYTYGIPQLLEILKKCMEEKVKHNEMSLKNFFMDTSTKTKLEKENRSFQEVIEACSNWVLDEFEVVED